MTSRAKIVYGGEWIITSPLMARRCPDDVDPRCELCRRLSCGPSWYSLKTHRHRCPECFTPSDAPAERAEL